MCVWGGGGGGGEGGVATDLPGYTRCHDPNNDALS